MNSKELIAASVACVLVAAIVVLVVVYLCRADPRSIAIDGCEYISMPVYGGRTLTHKGNCTNQIHAR